MTERRRYLGIICMVCLSAAVLIGLLAFYVGNREDAFAAAYTAEEIALEEIENLKTGKAYASDGNLYITEAGTYTLSGELENGQIVVDAGQSEICLILNGVRIQNEALSAIVIKSAGQTALVLQEGSRNEICITGDPAEDDPVSIPAVLVKEEWTTLTVRGTGSLIIETTAGDGISVKGAVVLEEGDLEITTGGGYLNGREHREEGPGGSDIPEEPGGRGGAGGRGGSDIPEDPGGRGGAGRPGGSDIPEEPGGWGGAGRPGGSDIPEEPGGRGGAGRPGGSDIPEEPGGPGGAGGPGEPEAQREDFGEQEPSYLEESQVSCKGIKAGTQLMIQGGNLVFNCADDGLHSNGSLVIYGGTIQIQTGDDGVHGNDRVEIQGGTLTISECYEGIEGKEILILDGLITIRSSDDGMNASDGSASGNQENDRKGSFTRKQEEEKEEIDETLPLLHIQGGVIRIDSEGDGLDSNGNLIIDGGDIVIDGPENGGNGALDSGAESGGKLLIHGGTILALGASRMAESFSGQSEQASFQYICEKSFEAGDEILIRGADGTELYQYTAQKSGDSIVFSAPGLSKDENGYQVIITPREKTRS